jgi:hypothetical protein
VCCPHPIPSGMVNGMAAGNDRAIGVDRKAQGEGFSLERAIASCPWELPGTEGESSSSSPGPPGASGDKPSDCGNVTLCVAITFTTAGFAAAAMLAKDAPG